MTTEWVTVPREPTEAMVAAGRSYAVPSTQAIIPIYTAMLSASPVPPSEPVGWRTIETAPRDGRCVLLWWRTCREPSVGWWEIRHDEFDDPPSDIVLEGWRNEDDQCIPKNQSDCTHWMPLPAAPGSAVPPSPPRDEVVEALRAIPDGAIEALRDGQRQLDMDGVEVGVSRQAIEEVLAAIAAALAKVEERS